MSMRRETSAHLRSWEQYVCTLAACADDGGPQEGRTWKALQADPRNIPTCRNMFAKHKQGMQYRGVQRFFEIKGTRNHKAPTPRERRETNDEKRPTSDDGQKTQHKQQRHNENDRRTNEQGRERGQHGAKANTTTDNTDAQQHHRQHGARGSCSSQGRQQGRRRCRGLRPARPWRGPIPKRRPNCFRANLSHWLRTAGSSPEPPRKTTSNQECPR